MLAYRGDSFSDHVHLAQPRLPFTCSRIEVRSASEGNSLFLPLAGAAARRAAQTPTKKRPSFRRSPAVELTIHLPRGHLALAAAALAAAVATTATAVAVVAAVVAWHFNLLL